MIIVGTGTLPTFALYLILFDVRLDENENSIKKLFKFEWNNFGVMLDLFVLPIKMDFKHLCLWNINKIMKYMTIYCNFKYQFKFSIWLIRFIFSIMTYYFEYLHEK